VKSERLVARVHAHSRSMGPKMDSLLYAILGSDRQILKGVEGSVTTGGCLVLSLRAKTIPGWTTHCAQTFREF
jgi:hypothetical protein